MSVRKIIKERKKVFSEIRNVQLSRETFLFTDSKGVGLTGLLPHSNTNFSVIYKRGATVYDKDFVNILLEKIHYVRDPVVLVWLGTCEITKKQKKGKYIRLLDYPYQNIENVLTEYRALKGQIERHNPSTTVLFIECPYYSLSRANNKIKSKRAKTTKQHRTLVIKSCSQNNTRKIDWSTKIDKEASDQIDYYNDHLKLINRLFATPRISQDMILSNRYKHDRRTTYKINYCLLTDGVHPCRILSKLWIYKFISLSMEVPVFC